MKYAIIIALFISSLFFISCDPSATDKNDHITPGLTAEKKYNLTYGPLHVIK